MPKPIKISLIIAAAEASERLSSYGYNVESVAFTADGLVMTGRDHNDIYAFTMTASHEIDDVGTATAVCEFNSKRHERPLKFSAGCDDFISALCLAIDEQAHTI
jgi:hypothetical protein